MSKTTSMSSEDPRLLPHLDPRKAPRITSVGGAMIGATLLAISCSSHEPIRPAPGTALPSISPKVSGMDKVWLGVGFELVGDRRKLDAIETWFFEALNQSPWLDLEIRNKPPLDHVILLRGSLPKAGGHKTILTTSLQQKGMAPIALASVELAPRTRLALALDALAKGTRLGLGEPRSSVAFQSASVEAIVSPLEQVAAACTGARRRADRRDRSLAISNLEKALQKDPSSAYLQCMLSSLLLDQGRIQRAMTYAKKVGATPERATPRLIHDAKRDILLATGRYKDMIRLADMTLKVRPRDPHVSFTKALAQCMLREYKAALPTLRQLQERLPMGRGVKFALAYALLGTSKAQECLALLPDLEKLLDKRLTTRIRCLCLYELGKLDELQEYLRTIAHDPEFRGKPGSVEITGIEACFALLRRENERAARLMLEQLDQLRAWPSTLDTNPQILLDAAWTLVRLGKSKQCTDALNAMRDIGKRNRRLEKVILLAKQMCRLASSKEALPEDYFRPIALMGLREAEQRLIAQNLIKKGHPDEALEIQRRLGLTSKDPALIVESAESLQALGHLDDARRILKEAARFVTIPRMDKPGNHPLLRVKYAYMVALSERL